MASTDYLPLGWAEKREIPNAAFVDSQGWMAIISTKDQDHEPASTKYAELVAAGWLLFTSTWTLYDAVSHIRERAKGGGYDVAERLWARANEAPLVRLLGVSAEIEDKAVEIFWKVRDKSWSVTTCANLVLMARVGITRVLSANRHYQQAGHLNLY